jgi:hypothetical protein
MGPNKKEIKMKYIFTKIVMVTAIIILGLILGFNIGIKAFFVEGSWSLAEMFYSGNALDKVEFSKALCNAVLGPILFVVILRVTATIATLTWAFDLKTLKNLISDLSG